MPDGSGLGLGSVIAGAPAVGEPVALPDSVARVIGGRPWRAAWRNELGGLTFEVGREPDRCFVKWFPAGVDLAAEVERLRWAASFLTVPRVLDVVDDVLVTAALPGASAVSPRWLARPRDAVRAVGAGLRRMHDVLPAGECPFTWSAADRVAQARRDHGGAAIEDPPPIDRIVVCHGDACAPNTLVADAGACSGHVDLGSLGTGDRWADLAVATWSTQWNYGDGWEDELLDAYGVDRDGPRIDFYRRLWELG